MKIDIKFFGLLGSRTSHKNAHHIQIKVDDADWRERVEAQGSVVVRTFALLSLLQELRATLDPDEGKTKEGTS